MSPSSTETILLTIPHPTNTNHNGGMLAFGTDRYLYIGVGDGGSGNDPPNNAQNTNVLLGKILRINVDQPDPVAGTRYSSPPDNPFVNRGRPGRDLRVRSAQSLAIQLRPCSPGSSGSATSGRTRAKKSTRRSSTGGNYGWRVYRRLPLHQHGPLAVHSSNYHLSALRLLTRERTMLADRRLRLSRLAGACGAVDLHLR